MAIIRDAREYDVRVVTSLSRRGELDRAAYAAHLAALPDEADEGVETETRFATPYNDRVETADDE